MSFKKIYYFLSPLFPMWGTPWNPFFPVSIKIFISPYFASTISPLSSAGKVYSTILFNILSVKFSHKYNCTPIIYTIII